MSEKGLVLDSQPHELKLGNSFDPKSRAAYHSIRYDFKPASVDTNQEAQLEIGEGHHVTLTVPHVEGSGKTHTVYKGHKRPVSKECVLVIDHDTGTFTLERLSNNIAVKKTRADNSTKPQLPGRPVTPVEPKSRSPSSKHKPSQPPPVAAAPPPVVHKQPSPPTVAPPVSMPRMLEHESSVIGEISDSSSDSDSMSGSDSDSEDEQPVKSYPPIPMAAMVTNKPAPPPVVEENNKKGIFMISADLQLSDSDSDSD